jgi:hypothetical protein
MNINAYSLVLILFYSYLRCYHWEKLGAGYTRNLSTLFLHLLMSSQLFQNKKWKVPILDFYHYNKYLGFSIYKKRSFVSQSWMLQSMTSWFHCFRPVVRQHIMVWEYGAANHLYHETEAQKKREGTFLWGVYSQWFKAPTSFSFFLSFYFFTFTFV